MLLGGQVLLGKTLEELQEFAKAQGQPAYRGKQLYDGLMHGAHSVEDITNVSPHAALPHAPPCSITLVILVIA